MVLTGVILVLSFYFKAGLLRPIGDNGRFVKDSFCWLLKAMVQDPRGMILTSMPALSRLDTPEEMENPGHALLSWVAGVARVNITPTGIIFDQIPMLGQIVASGEPVITESPITKEAPVIDQELSMDILVALYNTHTGEAYEISEGTERVTGKGGVVKVAGEIQRVLEKEFSIRVARSETVHDYQYAASYIESEKTAREMVANYSKMIAMLDIHRDAGRSREQSLVEINGKKAAPILLIIGSDARRPFPNWKENYDFACKIADKMDQLYPGLCIGVRVKEGRYNQFLHPGAVLVEMGTVNNSLEEATASGEMFARALGEVLREEIKTKEDELQQTNIDFPLKGLEQVEETIETI